MILEISDEFHYLFICEHLISHKKKYIEPFYLKHISTIKMHVLMNVNNIGVLRDLAMFTKIVITTYFKLHTCTFSGCFCRAHNFF